MMRLMTIHQMPRRMRDADYFVPEWTLGDRMRKALAVSGTPVNEIAEYLDVTPTTVGRWINDRGPVKRHILLTWAAATGVDPVWLETGTAGPQEGTGGNEYAIRDSNPEPADMSSRSRLTLIRSVNRPLTVDRIAPGREHSSPLGDLSRRLRAVV
jgi:transcriptional regulator with XRE-family HTH domain